MNKKWSAIKDILTAYDLQKEIFLSLITEEGRIVCANSNMIRKLHLGNPRRVSINISDIIHPSNLGEFKKGAESLCNENDKYGIELYLKNGHYHPMKWDINLLEAGQDAERNYFCVGYKTSNGQSRVNAEDGVADLASFDLELFFRNKKGTFVSGNQKIDELFNVRFNSLITNLKDKEAMFSGFMNNTPNLAWVVDEHANLIFASNSVYKFFGIEESDSINKNILGIVPTVVSDSLYEKHIDVLNTGKSIELVETAKWVSGQNFAFHINIFPIVGVNGSRYIGGYAVNLKEKFTIEKQLQEANNRLLMLTRATSDAIWEWDMQTGRVFRNDVLMDLVGYQQEDNKGLTWWFRRIHPIDRYRVSNKIKESTEAKQHSWEDEYRFKCADGTYKHMRDKGYIVYENDLPVKMIGSLQNISNLKTLENSLIEEKLERQKELSETVVHVQEKERTKIGHELHDNVNQILSTTKLYIDMLTPVDSSQQQIKEKSIEYIALAVEEIRKLSRELVLPQLNHERLADSIMTIITDIHLTTNVRITFTHEEESELLSPGKKLTIFRIVQEQIKNILKHSKATAVEISIKNKEMKTCLSITDNGVGFDSNQLHTGIGLSNIFERTRFYNGTVTMDTAPGKGCSLFISIPAL